MKLLIILIILALLGGGIVYLVMSYTNKPAVSQEVAGQKMEKNSAVNPVAKVETNLGTFEIELYQSDAPKTVANFVKLANKDFYNNLIFHRVVKDFVIQGGDPKGDGTGGPGYSFEDELNPQTKSYQDGYLKGTVAMANSGPNTNGSQWFVVLKDLPQLPKNYTIFGKIISGQEVVDKIGLVKVDGRDKPLAPVVMKKLEIINPTSITRNPKPDTR